MILLVCGYTVHITSILVSSAWSNRFSWWRSRIQVFVEKGKKWQFSTILSIALTHAGMKIHGNGCYHIIVWAEEYCPVCCTWRSHLLPLCGFMSNGKSFKIWAKIDYVCWAWVGMGRTRHANGGRREYTCNPMTPKWGTLGALYSLRCYLQMKMTQIDLKSTWKFTFQLLVHGVTVGWASTLYGTSTLAHACPMVGSAGSTRLSCGRKGGEYFHFQSINFYCTTNWWMGTLMMQLLATSPTVYTHIISSSSKHSSSWSSYKCVVGSIFLSLRLTFSAATL